MDFHLASKGVVNGGVEGTEGVEGAENSAENSNKRVHREH